MQEINFSSYAYCKMMLHAAKYPQCAVNGILLASIDENSDKTQLVTYVNAVPMFHLCLHVSPMAEIALSQVCILHSHINANQIVIVTMSVIMKIFIFVLD